MTIMHAEPFALSPVAVAMAGLALMRAMRRIEIEEHQPREAQHGRFILWSRRSLPQPGE